MAKIPNLSPFDVACASIAITHISYQLWPKMAIIEPPSSLEKLCTVCIWGPILVFVPGQIHNENGTFMPNTAPPPPAPPQANLFAQKHCCRSYLWCNIYNFYREILQFLLKKYLFLTQSKGQLPFFCSTESSKTAEPSPLTPLSGQFP